MSEFNSYPLANSLTGTERILIAQGTNTLNTTLANVSALTPPAAFVSTTNTGPDFPSSTTVSTMQGLATYITPSWTGRLIISISGTIVSTVTTVGTGISFQIRYGTGTAPRNGDALTGTGLGTGMAYTQPTASTAAADVNVPFELIRIVANLTVGQSYWIDLGAVSRVSAGTVGMVNINVSAVEF